MCLKYEAFLYKVDSREGYLTDLEFSKEERKDPSRNEGCQKVGFEPATLRSVVQRSNHSAIQLQLPNRRKIFAIYAPTLLMYIVASPDPNPRGGGQLPNPNKCNSMLTSATRGEALTPNPKSAILC